MLDLRSSPTVLPSLLSTPVETRSPPSKVISPHLFYLFIDWLIFCKNERPYSLSKPNDSNDIVPMPFHKIPFGGGGRNRTAVQKSFALKGLQQFFTSYHDRGTRVLLRSVHTVLYPLILEKTTRTFANLHVSSIYVAGSEGFEPPTFSFED